MALALNNKLLYTHLPYHNDTTTITDAWRKTPEERKQEGRRRKTSLEKYSPLTLFVKFERVVQRLHVRECWRPNINFIFWPHCYDRHVVSLLFSWCWGLLYRGFPRAPSVGCGLPYHISSLTLWESAGNYIGGFPSAPSVECGLPYYIWSLLSGTLLAIAPGVFRVPPRSGVAFPTTSGLYCLEVCWQLHQGFPRSPSVWCGLPYHISSLTLWESAGNCFGTPNSTELNNNSTPTRSPTGSLKSDV